MTDVDPEVKKLWEQVERELKPEKDRRATPRQVPRPKPNDAESLLDRLLGHLCPG